MFYEKPNYLLTRDNPKVVKSKKQGIFSAVMMLAPATLSGANTCAHSTAGCAAACLNTAGRGGIGLDSDGLNTIQIARIRRTTYLRKNRELFNEMLNREITTFVRYAERNGFTPAIRLNGTSDLPFENLKFCGSKNIFEKFPHVQFYDYTKYPVEKRNLDIPNYHLTFSLADGNRQNAIDAIRAGINVAVVFRDEIPATYSLGGKFWRVIDGDKTDARFTDPSGCIVGLRAKGKAKKDTSGFVIDTKPKSL